MIGNNIKIADVGWNLALRSRMRLRKQTLKCLRWASHFTLLSLL